MAFSVDEFLRAVEVNRVSPHALFLGAGASVSSGVQSTDSCIWDWKRRLFITNNPGLKEFVRELSSGSVRRRIQRWLDSEGKYPRPGVPEEYGALAEACFPLAEDRRRYFQDLATTAHPHAGYQLAALIAETGLIRSVWTTNFDSLFVRAAAKYELTPIEVGLDTAERVYRPPAAGEVIHVALHGDYRYDALKNTSRELQEQDQRLREALVATLKTDSLIVLGYSGRDESVMEALTSAYQERGQGRLYWGLFADSDVPPRVQDLLNTAHEAGRAAFLVRIEGFDDTLARLAEQCLDEPRRKRAHEIWRELTQFEPPPKFCLPAGEVTEIIKSNAFPIKPPVEVLEVDVASSEGAGLWTRMRNAIIGKPLVAAVSRGKFLGFGDSTLLRQALGSLAGGPVRRTSLQPEEVSRPEISGLLAEAVVKSLALAHSLSSNGRSVVWQDSRKQAAEAQGVEWAIHAAASLAVRRYAGDLYLVLEPTIVAIDAEGKLAPKEVQKEMRRRLLVRQYNKQFNDEANFWRNLLLPEERTTLKFPPGDAPFEFQIDNRPLFAGVRTPGETTPPSFTPNVIAVIRQFGGSLQEPALVFSRKDGQSFVRDPHPMRGLADNRPYDFRLTSVEREPTVRGAVICPLGLEGAMSSFLAHLNARARPDSKPEYLLPFPGFGAAFGLALDLPNTSDERWIQCPDPGSTEPLQASRELAEAIVRGIDRLEASAGFDVLFIGVPRRWKPFESYENDDESFDLHDFVKAHCVQRGIATQFLREETFTKPHQCEIRWWLALAIYAKSMRTPWLLGDLDDRTAFLGLGFSLKPKRGSGGHVVLGCSHIYNAEGQGLRYRLSRMESPIVRGKNPFMSYEDARRMAEAARQLLTERGTPLPERVVMHRRTQYLEEEMRGLRDGLGVRELELLEITVEPRLRYVASRFSGKGKISGDTFPVHRGYGSAGRRA
jgi:SIR2-like protein